VLSEGQVLLLMNKTGVGENTLLRILTDRTRLVPRFLICNDSHLSCALGRQSSLGDWQALNPDGTPNGIKSLLPGGQLTHLP